MVVFTDEVSEVSRIPAHVLDEILDVHLLPDGKPAGIHPVVLAADKIVHEPAESFIVKLLCAIDTCCLLKDASVFGISQVQFFFNDMYDGEFVFIHVNGRFDDLRFWFRGSIFCGPWRIQ